MNRRNFVSKAGTGLLALGTLPYLTNLNSIILKNNNISVGFIRQSINPCIGTQTSFRRDLEAVCAVIGTPGNWTVIIALDLLLISASDCQKYQKEISEMISVPAEHILIHATHTHSAPWEKRFNNKEWGGSSFTGLTDLLGKMCLKAISTARPAKIKYGEHDVGQSLSVYRRGNAGPDLGFQTFWFGFKYHAGDDRPDASALVNEMKARWLGKTPEYVSGVEPVWFDKPVDSKVQSVVFEDNHNKTIGSIVRFSAHPHLSSACGNKLYDPDFPACTRDIMEEKIGGTCMFLLGTAANLVPKEKVEYKVVPEKSPVAPYSGPNWAFVPVNDNELLDEMKRIGRDIALAALKGLENKSSTDLRNVVHKPYLMETHLDPALPRNIEELSNMKKMLLPEYESFLRTGLPLVEMRLLANRFNWIEWAGIKSLGSLTDDNRKAGMKEMPISVLRLNDINLVFMHSEMPKETDEALHKYYPEMKLITLTMTGGYIEYIPTDEMIDEGGYEGRSCVIAYGTEKKIRSFISEKLENL